MFNNVRRRFVASEMATVNSLDPVVARCRMEKWTPGARKSAGWEPGTHVRLIRRTSIFANPSLWGV